MYLYVLRAHWSHNLSGVWLHVVVWCMYMYVYTSILVNLAITQTVDNTHYIRLRLLVPIHILYKYLVYMVLKYM